MIDLSSIAGLPIYLDEQTGEVIYDSNVKCGDCHDVKLQDLVPVLLNKYLKYPEQIYRHFKNVVNEDDSVVPGFGNLKYDIVKIPFGLVGIEFLKTHIFYSNFQQKKYSCIVEVLNGEVTVILQKNADDQDYYAYNTLVEDIEILKLTCGDRIAIPSGYMYTFVNTGTGQAVFSILSANDLHAIDYHKLDKEKGLAFYIISKNARLEVVANPKYRVERKPKYRSLKEVEASKRSKFSIIEKLLQGNSLYNALKTNHAQLQEVLMV